MNTTLLVITDGRGEYLTQTLNSFAQKVKGHIAHSFLIDDSASEDYANWLDDKFPEWFDGIVHHETRRGFAGAVQSGWDNLPKDTDFIFHLEDDFTFNQIVNVDDLVAVLVQYPYLAQMVLRRQPINDIEIAQGGVVPLNAIERHWKSFTWLEHQRNFSTNPSVYTRFIAQLGFPQAEHDNERLFSEQLKQMGFRYGYWGKRTDAPLVEHIGLVRAGSGY